MTNREFYKAVMETSSNPELVTFATEAIEKMDERNAKRSEKPSKAQVANAPLKKNILDWVTEHDETVIASAVGEAMSITTQKASALLRQLVDEGSLSKSEVKVPKKGKQVGYTLVKE
jgi:hypothetical protein